MYSLSIQHLKLIDTIVREGSVTQAAEKLFVTQPALSHQLRELEEGLGIPVFRRISKKLVLTEAGQRLLDTAERILPEVSRLQHELVELKEGKTGTIRLSTECYTCYHWLPAVIHEFRKQYGEVRVEIVTEATRRPLEYLYAGKLDVAIVSKFCEESGAFTYQPLFEDEMVMVVAREHPLAGRTAISPVDFQDADVIMYDVDDRYSSLIQQVLQPNGIQPRTIQKMQLTEAIIEMVSANLGITMLANWAVKPFLPLKNIVAIPFSPGRRRTWHTATFAQPGPVVEAFIYFTKAHFAQANQPLARLPK